MGSALAAPVLQRGVASWRRALAAAGGAGLGVGVAIASGAEPDALTLVTVPMMFAVLAVASVIDYEERRIPNRLTYPAVVVSLVLAVVVGAWPASVAGLVAAGGFMFVAALIGRGQLGMGDVKLSAFAGAALGIQGVSVFLVAATLSGAVFAVAMLLRHRDRHATLAYGPSLAIGAAIAALSAGTIVS